LIEARRGGVVGVGGAQGEWGVGAGGQGVLGPAEQTDHEMHALEIEAWAQREFGGCDLGDARRTRRLVKVASDAAAAPDASLPAQAEGWTDVKAAYRLFDAEGVTFDRVATPHWERTKSQTTGTWLVLGDTTEIDFGRFREAEGLGPVGKGGAEGRGFLLHSGLMVDPDGGVVGLAGQVIRYRRPAPEGERSYDTLKRDRESLVWGELVERIGPPAEGVRFIHVYDRGADNFEVFCRLKNARCDWVIRAARLNRVLTDGRALGDVLDASVQAGNYELDVPSRRGQKRRTAKLVVRFESVELRTPHHRSPWLKRQGVESMELTAVRVEETKAPKGATALSWTLLTSLKVDNFDDAWRVIGHYEKRWGVEEFHKALKTGCRVEARQLQTAERLEPLTALLCVTAVRLLGLRTLARSEPNRPAKSVVPRAWIAALRSLRPQRKIETVDDFFRQLAGLGGHLGRKSDGPPGWLTLYRGLEKLQLAVRAVVANRIRCG